MNDPATIKTTLEKTIENLARNPEKARRTFRVDASLGDGLRVTTTEGRWQVTMDMSEAMGGHGSAPNPGVFARAALLGCVVVGVRIEAARAGIPLDDLDMSLQSDGDGRSILGLDDAGPAFDAFRLYVRIKTTAREGDVREMIDRALERSPWWNVLSRPQNIRADVSIVAPE